jgi:aldose 1-epimerase
VTGLRAGKRIVDGLTALTLASPEEGGIEAAFVPGAGMVGCSLSHREGELLGQRGGLRAYATERSTMGIPLLYPWANRLGERRFEVAGRTVDVDASSPTAKEDPNGLPIHGLLSAAHGWVVTRHDVTENGATLVADFDFGAHRQIARGFPFPHELSYEATLSGGTLTIATTVRATGDATVPIAFGYHPYFRLPNIPRSDWEIELPVRERLRLDERMLPTGHREAITVSSGPLGSRTFDDAYLAPGDSAPFTVSGGGRRIEVTFDSGYPYAQVYAPADDDVIALEPMTAPTNALITGGPELPLVAPGSEFRASFSITIASG